MKQKYPESFVQIECINHGNVLVLVIGIHFTVAIARLKFMVIKRSVISVVQYYNNLTRKINGE